MHTIKSKPAPTNGINARDGIAAMGEQDAVLLVNWIPDTYGVRCRKGYQEWAKNFPSTDVEAVFSYVGRTTSFPGGSFLTVPTSMPGFLFAATKDGIYNITTSTASPGLSKALSGAANAGWIQTAMLGNTAGHFLLCTSETDGYLYFDGAAWTTVTLGGGAGQVSGKDPATFVQVLVHKKRAWFVERNSTNAWYLAADAITGAATQFDFGSQFKSGGQLSYLAKWTIDAGEGIDDFLVAVSSMGDVVVYKGTNPAVAADWTIVGTWNIGQVPVGRRAFTQFGGDLVLISADGIFPMSYVTRGGADSLLLSGQEYASMIRQPLAQDLGSTFTARGWDVLLHPKERVLCINVPNYSGRTNFQYCMSTSKKAWCYLHDIPVYCYGTSAGYSFAGTKDGRVLLIFSGYFDNLLLGANSGNGISGAIVPAFSAFEAPTVDKIFTMVRPTFQSVDTPNIVLGISVDYELAEPQGTPAFSPITQDVWDTGLWDIAVWGGATRIFKEWQGVGGVGFVGAASLSTLCVGDTTLVSLDYMMGGGGVV
jgi:hypothetical protein